MTPTGTARDHQQAFASTVAALLRRCRQEKHLTQSAVASRTDGVISKAALANYETGHRSLRIEVFCTIARALGEDPGALLAQAEKISGFGHQAGPSPITVNVAAAQSSDDPRLAPVRRWFAMRLRAGGTRLAVDTVTLDGGALAALAELMGVSVAECRRVLADLEPTDAHDVGGHAASHHASQPIAHAS